MFSRTLRDKFHSSRLVRSISSGSYSILHNQSSFETRKDELEKLVEEKTPNQQHRPRLKIQKSQSSDAVLESDGESTPQHKPKSNNVTDSPPLWVENPNTLLRSSWSEHTFQNHRHSLPVNGSRTNGGEHHSACTTPTTRISRLTFDGPLSTVRDVIEENSENADEPNMMATADNEAEINVPKDKTDLLVDLDLPTENYAPRGNFKSSHTISDFATQAFTPCIESRELPHSISHSSGYHSLAEEDNGFHCHREFAGCLNTSGTRRPSLKCRDLELKTFSPGEQSQNSQNSASIDPILPPPPSSLCKERARSLDRASQRKLVRSYPSGGSITPTILMSTSIVEDSFMAHVEKKVSGSEINASKRKEQTEPSDYHWSRSPARSKPEQHNWQLCLYMFGGREQGAPGIYRQPISIWKLYV